jgi:hypothetical protein
VVEEVRDESRFPSLGDGAQREDFDPGAKYYVPANTAYTRHSLAQILHHQFASGNLAGGAEQRTPVRLVGADRKTKSAAGRSI